MSIQVVSIGGVSLLHKIYYQRIMYRFIILLKIREDVIRHGGSSRSMLVFTEPTYTEAILIDVVRDMGPYIVLAPGPLLCRMRVQRWVAKQSRYGFLVATLEKPIDFGS